MKPETKLAKEKEKAEKEHALAVKKFKDSKSWVKFAKKKKVSTPFFTVDSAIFRTSDGKWYSSVEEYTADGGASDGSNSTTIPTKK